MKCPYCAHENPSDAERCASCLQKLEAAPTAETIPAAPPSAPALPSDKLVCARCGTTNPYDARICSCCQGPLEPSTSLAPATQSQSAPTQASGKVVGCIVALGVLGGASFASRGLLKSPPSGQEQRPAASDSSAPGKDDPRAPLIPKTVPQTDKPPKVDPRAEFQYRLALAWLRRGDTEQARRLLEDVMRKFPGSPYAGRAQAHLERLPPPSESAGARREQAIADLRNRYRDEGNKGKKQATITEDDIGGISRIPSDMKTPKVVVPRAAAESPAPEQDSANRLTLVYAYAEDDQVTLKVAYQLGGPHQKPVHAAARLTYPAGNSFFAYGAETLAPGSGQTTIVMRLSVPIAVSRPASIRLMLFESQGPMFFSVTVPYP